MTIAKGNNLREQRGMFRNIYCVGLRFFRFFLFKYIETFLSGPDSSRSCKYYLNLITYILTQGYKSLLMMWRLTLISTIRYISKRVSALRWTQGEELNFICPQREVFFLILMVSTACQDGTGQAALVTCQQLPQVLRKKASQTMEAHPHMDTYMKWQI